MDPRVVEEVHLRAGGRGISKGADKKEGRRAGHYTGPGQSTRPVNSDMVSVTYSRQGQDWYRLTFCSTGPEDT